MDPRPVLFVNGALLLVLAGTMLVPAAVDYMRDDRDWKVFAASAMTTAFLALVLMFGSRPEGRFELSVRQAFLLTASVWVTMSLAGALPFYFADLDLDLAGAIFESTSGITTTGATVLSGLDDMPYGILLWRALLHWLGGIGIIVMAVAVLPILRIGGMQLFRMESSDKTDKVKPRVAQVAVGLLVVYVVLTLVSIILLWVAGMSFFDAVCFAMSAIATGGYAPRDASAGYYDSALIHWLLIGMMVVGGMSFVLFITPWKRKRWAILHDTQIRWYLWFLAAFSALMAFWQWAVNDMALAEALRHGTFNVVSVVTTTGFASTDYNQWGGFATVTFFVLTFIGGCTGSTSGGIKIFRWEVMFAMAGVHLRRLIHPHGTFVVDFNHERVSDAVVKSVLGFVVLYFLIFAVLAILLTMTGLDFVTALSGAAATLTAVGPGLGDTIGPAGNFAPLPDSAKLICSAAMVLGRLELFPVLVLLSRTFWRE